MSARIVRRDVPSWSGPESGSRPEPESGAISANTVQRPPLPLEVIHIGRLLRAAIGEPLRRWAIVLFLEGGPGRLRDDLRAIVQQVPWFRDFPLWGFAFAQLRRHGLTVLTTAEGTLARRLFRDIPPGGQQRVSARLFNPEGRVRLVP